MPWDDPSDPFPREKGFGSAESRAWFDREHEREEAWWESPTGIAQQAKLDAERAAEKRKKERIAIATDAKESGVPSHSGIMEVVLAHPTELAVTDAIAAFHMAMKWRQERKSDFGSEPVLSVVGGPPGTGKSAALARFVARHPKSSLYLEANTIATTPWNGWSKNDELWAKWHEVDLLGIDDLGTEVEDNRHLLTQLLVTRYNEGKATLMTTNLPMRECGQTYIQGRLKDRIGNGQDGLPWYVATQGPSLRNAGAREAFIRSAMATKAAQAKGNN